MILDRKGDGKDTPAPVNSNFDTVFELEMPHQIRHEIALFQGRPSPEIRRDSLQHTVNFTK
jgi:hypothetical protein